jgi:integrase/recombinase XerD
MMKKKIELDSIQIGNKQHVAVRFEYNQVLIDLAKSLNMTWNPRFKIWLVIESDYLKKTIISEFSKYGTVVAADLHQVNANYSKLNDKIKLDTSINDIAKMHLTRYSGVLANRRYSKSTVETYTSLLKRFFAFFYDRDPLNLTMDDLGDFNNTFIISNNYSINTQRQLISAIKLFYENTDNHKMSLDRLIRPKKSKRLPLILEQNEIIKMIEHTSNLKHRTILSLLYGTGMRLSEVLHLEIKHIQSEEMYINIVNAKGRKDRNVPLSKQLLGLLRKYYKQYHPKKYLIEGANGGMYSSSSLNNVVKSAAKKAGIHKTVSCHTLRHSYATHLLDKGTNLRYIQELLGHSDSKTTEIYTYVRPDHIRKIVSPLDDLPDILLEEGINYNKPKFIPWHSEG